MTDVSAPDPRSPTAGMAERDRTAALLGYQVVAVDAGRAVVTMLVTEDMVNGLDVCHGGIIFTLADSAMAHASNSHGSVAFAVAASIDFVSPARLGSRLTATATEQFRRRRTALYDVAVTDDEGSLVARFHGRTQVPSRG